MLSLFGNVPNRLRSRFPEGIHAIVTDHEHANVSAAFREAVRRRERGHSFYTMALLEHPPHRAFGDLALTILTQVDGYDRRMSAFHQLRDGTLNVNGKAAREFLEAPPAFSPNYGNFLSLGDELLVRSSAEYHDMLCSGTFPPMGFRRMLLRAEIPAFERVAPKRPSVVVWNGIRPVADAATALFGLGEFRGDITYVADEPIRAEMGARFMRPNDVELPEVLGRSAVVICTDPTDPADAAAFAETGIGVISPLSARAYEFAHGIVPWIGTDASKIYAAVAIALARETSLDRTMYAIPLAPSAPALPPDDALPLVSIITATYNRRDYLREMLTCLANQTYPNIESIVVNDAGVDVADIVADFPFARLITLPTNRGSFGAAEAGLAIARGDYIGLLPDDDAYYPNHIALLVSALHRSGAAVAHGSAIVRYLRPGPDGTVETYGFNTANYNSTVNPTWAQIGTPVAAHQCLQARATFAPEDVGWYLNDQVAADQEYHMRLVERYQLAFVQKFTCEFRDHPRNTGKNFNWADVVEEIYRLNPLPNRPIVEAQRRATIEKLRSVPVGQNVHEPTLRFEPAERFG